MAIPLINTLREPPQQATSPQDQTRRARLAELMLREGTDTSPVGHWSQGAARLANALVGGYMSGKVGREEKASEDALSKALVGLPGLDGGETAPAPAGAPSSGPADSRLIQAVIGQESGGDPNAVSPKGATGIMQVMPDTAKDPGFGVQPFDPNTPLTDPQENQRFGTDYLNAMLKRYDGDLDAALVAYNAGPGRADAWLKAGKDMSLLPAETQDYLVKVKGRMEPAQSAQAGTPMQAAQPDTPPGTHRMPDGSIMRDDAMPGQQAGAQPQGIPQAAPTPQAAPRQMAQAGPQIPPQMAQQIRGLLANPATRKMGMQLYQQYAKPQSPPSSVREFEYGQQNPAFREYQRELEEAGGTNVTIDQKAPGEFGKALGKGLADDFLEQRTAAQDAVKSLQGAVEARQLLDSGVITGFGADFGVGFGKALQQAGWNVAPDAIANTEAFVASRAKEVGRIIKLFGAGTGLSDADRAYAEKAAAGEITMTEESIRRILDINERASKNVIKNYNEQAAQIPEGASPFPLAIDMPEAQPAPKVRSYNPETGRIE